MTRHQRRKPSICANCATQIDELKPTLGAGDLIACVREAADLEAPKDKSARAIVVISDGQRFGWRIDERPLWAAVQARLEQAAIPSSGQYSICRRRGARGEPVRERIACAARVRRGEPSAELHRHSAEPQRRSRARDAPRLARQRPVRGRQRRCPNSRRARAPTLSLSHQFDAAGFEVTCHLEAKDALRADNEGHLLVEIFERLPVLLVEDPASPDPLQNDSAFVLAALGRARAAMATASGARFSSRP